MHALELDVMIILSVPLLAGELFSLPKHVLGEFTGRTYMRHSPVDPRYRCPSILYLRNWLERRCRP
ncbi:MAG: hypothetical protein ACXV2E_06455 [Halobacteriota archaeon]